MKRSLAVVAIAATFSGATLASAAGVERPWTHYNDLLSMLKMDRFYAAPPAQRDKIIMQGVIKPHDTAIAAQDVVLTIVHGGERRRIPVGADGGFEVPFKQEWVKANPEVFTSIPAGQKSQFSIRALPVLPRTTELDYATLMGSVPQINALIKTQAGVLRFMMPTFVGITLQFPREAHASVAWQEAGATRRVAADANGLVKLPLDQALLAANVPVTLSALPAGIEFIEN